MEVGSQNQNEILRVETLVNNSKEKLGETSPLTLKSYKTIDVRKTDSPRVKALRIMKANTTTINQSSSPLFKSI